MEFSTKITNIMAAVDRRYFSPNATSERPQLIGYNATISARSIHAMTLHYLDIQQNDNILDVGCGSGYLCSLFAYCGGIVTGIDHIPELVQLSNDNIKRATPHLIDKIQLHCGDGRKGYLKNAKYDKINIGAACEEIYPDLLDQMKIGGLMLLPLILSDDSEYLHLVTKTNDGFKIRKLCRVYFIPLTEKEIQMNKG